MAGSLARRTCANGARVASGAAVSTLTAVRDKVEQVIEVIRPAIQADNGDVILHDVDEATGVVTVELIGACVSCAASTVTLKAGLERILKDRVEGVTEVIDSGPAGAALGETAVSL